MHTQDEIRCWLVQYLSRKLDVGEELIDTTLMFDRFGLDSLTVTSLVAELGEYVGHDLDPSLAYDHPTIDDLAVHLAQMPASDETVSTQTA